LHGALNTDCQLSTLQVCKQHICGTRMHSVRVTPWSDTHYIHTLQSSLVRHASGEAVSPTQRGSALSALLQRVRKHCTGARRLHSRARHERLSRLTGNRARGPRARAAGLCSPRLAPGRWGPSHAARVDKEHRAKGHARAGQLQRRQRLTQRQVARAGRKDGREERERRQRGQVATAGVQEEDAVRGRAAQQRHVRQQRGIPACAWLPCWLAGGPGAGRSCAMRN